MTRTQPTYTVFLSANDEFKFKYPRYLKAAVLVALVLTALLLWLWPDVPANPYRLRQKVEMVWIDVPDPLEIPEPPQVQEAALVPPDIVAAPEDDPTTVEPWWGQDDFWDNIPAPSPATPSYDGFTASSALPRLQFQARAEYPEIARRLGMEGTVMVHLLVNVHGRVAQAVVTESAHPMLDKAALAAAWKCQFTPAKQREMKVEVWVAVPYRFRLR
jgi:protein TonB|nr:TonB family protein [Candidatus Krumholzibacteria bacterium]